MELIVDFLNKKEVIKLLNIFEIVVEFMEGDADGADFHKIYFTEKEYENEKFKEELSTFLKSIQSCVKKDRKGRGGFDEYSDLLDEYRKVSSWARFCTSVQEFLQGEDIDDLLDEDEIENLGVNLYSDKSKFNYCVPTDNSGFFHSYRNLDVFYYNENGDKFPVTIKL